MGSSGTSSRRTAIAGGFVGGLGSSGSGVGPINTTPNNLQPNVTVTPANQNNPNVQSQTPTAQNTPTTPAAVTNLTKMSDDELAALVYASQKAQMPNFLADYNSATQQFVFQAGVNEKPTVLNASEFAQFMQDNNIPQSQVMSRSVNNASYTNQQGYTVKYSGDQINNMLKHSRLNYIGGKQGGNCYGQGAYFDMRGGGQTGYGSNTIEAVLNPKTAKVIEYGNAYKRAKAFAQSHPKFARAVGTLTDRTISIYALAMGYNVISEYSPSSKRGYHCVIDRSALVIKE